MLTTEIILFILLAYLTGAFPSAVWVGKTFYKIDEFYETVKERLPAEKTRFER